MLSYILKGAHIMSKVNNFVPKHLIKHSVLLITGYSSFKLSKIKESQGFMVDSKLLSVTPKEEKNFSIQVLGG